MEDPEQTQVKPGPEKKPKVRYKKKDWYSIVSPKSYGEQVLGETTIMDPNTAVGRTIVANLMTLSGNPKKQSVNITFTVTKYAEGKLMTEITGYTMVPSFVRRMVRRGCERVDDSFVYVTSDNKKVRMKPLFLTRSRTYASKLKSLRKLARQFMLQTLRKMTFDQAVEEIIGGRIQLNIRKHIKNVYPLRLCDIRMATVVGEGDGEPILDVVEEVAPVEESASQESSEDSEVQEPSEEPAVEEAEPQEEKPQKKHAPKTSEEEEPSEE